MRAAYFRGNDQIEFVEVPSPRPGPGEVLIRSFYFTLPEFAANQRLIVDGTLDAAPLASHRFPLGHLRAAYDLFGAGEALKVLVEP